MRRLNCASPPQEGTDDVAEGGELKPPPGVFLIMCLVGRLPPVETLVFNLLLLITSKVC